MIEEEGLSVIDWLNQRLEGIISPVESGQEEGIEEDVSTYEPINEEGIEIEEEEEYNNNEEEEYSEETNEGYHPLSDEDQALLEKVVSAAHSETSTISILIPTNSPTLLRNETTSRFSSAIWYNKIQEKSIILAGLGGIGSWTALLLAKLNPKSMYLYDLDRVEAGNLSGQLYSVQDIESYKVDAVAKTISNYANYNKIYSIREFFTRMSNASDIMICGFDNMKARKDFYYKWKEHVMKKPNDDKHNCLYIDGRLSAEYLQVLCIKGDDSYSMNRYENSYLFDDWEAEETVCSYKQTSFMANMIGSIITNLFVNFCANECGLIVGRDLPFYTEYTAETMYFKTIA